MKITIIGTGYVGLVSGSCFSEFGFNVSCFDIDEQKIAQLNQGKIPIYEQGLEEIVARNQKEGRLNFTCDLNQAVSDSQVIFLAVGTPTVNDANNLQQGAADLSFIKSAAISISTKLSKSKHTVIVVKSTVPIGTSRKLRHIIQKHNPQAKFSIVANPEFLREGSAVNDFFRPDRVIIGLEDEAARPIMDRLYRPLYLFETPKLYTDLETAETIKYAANSFLATKIAFINEVADLCEKTGADVQQVATGIGLDNRIGRKFLHPSPGFGGSCFPKDLRGLIATSKEHNVKLSIAEAVNSANYNRVTNIANKILAYSDNSLKDKNIAILGVAFKPNTDDIRESPALRLIQMFHKLEANLKVYDPIALSNAKHYFKNITNRLTFSDNSYAAIEDCNIIVIVTEWNEFRSLDLAKIAKIMRAAPNNRKMVVDLRNIYTATEVQSHGLDYYSIGRKNIYNATKVLENLEYTTHE